MEIESKKTELRRLMKNLLRENSASCAAAEKLVALDEFQVADIVLGYAALPYEADCIFALESALASGKATAVPKCADSFAMDFYLLDSSSSIESQLETGRYGIREPKPLLQKLDFATSSCTICANCSEGKIPRVLMIVPGLAFTERGERLGRGKGFYDRYISGLKKLAANNQIKLTLAGFCFSFQIVPNIPTTDHDEKMNLVVF